LPTGVGVRYGRSPFWREAFLGGLGPRDFCLRSEARLPSHASASGFAWMPHFWRRADPVHLVGSPSLPRPPFAPNELLRCRTI
jgi:hypothetical protein